MLCYLTPSIPFARHGQQFDPGERLLSFSSWRSLYETNLCGLSNISYTLKFRILIFAPLVSPSPTLRLAEATYPGDHEKVGAGQPTDWAALPGKGNDSPWLGPTFREEETTYLGIYKETTHLRGKKEGWPTFDTGCTLFMERNDPPWDMEWNDLPWRMKQNDPPCYLERNDLPLNAERRTLVIGRNDAPWGMRRNDLPWKIEQEDAPLSRREMTYLWM